MFVKSKRFKSDTRLRRKIRIRKRISGTDQKPRLSVFKSSQYTYASVISDIDGKTLLSVSTADKEVAAQASKLDLKELGLKAVSTKSVAAAMAMGIVLGQRAKAQKIEALIFDRNGFVFHGRVKAVADGIRQTGIKV